MPLSKALIKLFCIPFLCTLMLMAYASSVTFASATREATLQTSCPVLQNGSTDSDSQGKVTVLQKKLKADGEGKDLGTSGKNNDGVDGIFGDKTEKAVSNFQTKHNLSSDGVVGDNTWKALKGCDDSTSGSNRTKTSTKQVRGDACLGSIGCGSATFTFTGKNQLTNISMSVKDTVCDSKNVYIELRIYYYGGQTKDVERLENKGGCNSTVSAQHAMYTLNETYARAQAATIDGVRVRVCINESLASDKCVSNEYAKYIDNPNVE